MQTSYEIRWAKEEEWAPAMRMIWRTFMEYDSSDYTQEGIKNFFDFISDDDLFVAFLRGNYQLMVALDGDKIIGAGSLRNRNHLSLLFVDGAYHRLGVGKAILDALCHYLRDEAGEKFLSVKAAPFAIGFYKKEGFTQIGQEEEYSGIRVTSMEKVF